MDMRDQEICIIGTLSRKIYNCNDLHPLVRHAKTTEQDKNKNKKQKQKQKQNQKKKKTHQPGKKRIFWLTLS